MLARKISTAGLLFIGFMLLLIITIGNPLDNILRKLFKGNKKLTGIIEWLIVILLARALAHAVEPTVTKASDYLLDMFFDLLRAIAS